MPDAASPADAVLTALGFALFERGPSGALCAASDPPSWLKLLWPNIAAIGSELVAAEVSPFLDNFLVDAEECWRAGEAQRTRSGPWVEQNARGDEIQLDATALTIEGQPLLLIERLGDIFEAKKSMLQTARETVIAHQRLNSEIQKKEILLHCVAEEMSAALANIITSLRLLELEESSARSTMLLELAVRGAQEQQTLIHKVLAVFEDELGGMLAPEKEVTTGLLAAARNAVELMAPAFAEKNVRLRALLDEETEVIVALDADRLERAIANLLENAIERIPSGGEVRVAAEVEADAVLLVVEDNGRVSAGEPGDESFPHTEPTSQRSPAVELRMRFCRLVAESCGGEIASAPLDTGGNRFWIRLPRGTK